MSEIFLNAFDSTMNAVEIFKQNRLADILKIRFVPCLKVFRRSSRALEASALKKVFFSICDATGLIPLCYARRLRRRSGAPRYVADEVPTPVRSPYEEVGWRPSAIVSEVVVG